jgi:hypothetical protein
MVNEMIVFEEMRGQDIRHSTYGSRGQQASKQRQQRASGQRPVAEQSSNGSSPALCSSGRHVAVLFFVFCFTICPIKLCMCVCVLSCVGVVRAL